MSGIWDYLRLSKQERAQLMIQDWCKGLINNYKRIGALQRKILGGKT